MHNLKQFFSRGTHGALRIAGVGVPNPLTALTVFGVALGVAAVWGIQLINHNAIASFRAGLQSVTGETELSVFGPTSTLDEKFLPVVYGTPGVRNAWPLLHVDVGLPTQSQYFIRIIGVDFLAEQSIPWKDDSIHIDQVLSQPGWVAVSTRLAAERHWSVGDSIEVALGSRLLKLNVGALVDFSRFHPQADYKVAMMDIAQAQHFFGLVGKLHQIDVKLSPGASADIVAQRLRDRLGKSLQVLTPEQQEKRAAGLLEAFRINLTALSLISLLVGFFLVYMSMQASIVRRRAEFGLRRTLGATQGQVLQLVLTESLLLGSYGVLIGMPMGYALAAANLHSVSATVSNLYLLAEVQTLHVSPLLFFSGITIGLAGALAGAFWPAMDLCRTDTLRLMGSLTLQEQIRDAAEPLAWGALGVLTFTAILYALFARQWPILNFGLAAGLLISVIMIAPRLIQYVSAHASSDYFGFLYSVRQLDQGLQTVSMAVGALAIAVSMLVGVTLMVSSFRQTLNVWANHVLQADIYISPESWLRSRELSAMEPSFLETLKKQPGVMTIDSQRVVFSQYEGHRVTLTGVRTDLTGHPERFVLQEGDLETVESRLRQGEILLGEPFARHTHKHYGDLITLAGPRGPVAFRVAGVFADFNVDFGTALLDQDILTQRLGAGPINNVAVYLVPGLDADQAVDKFKAVFADKPLLFRSNRTLRAEIFRVFDQTFAVTKVLELLALVIAACGIALTLLILARERRAELALYAALGATRGQRLFFFLGKGLGMGSIGLLLGSIGGFGLALILVYAVNRTYFGWTIALQWPGWLLAQEAGIVLLVCVIASLGPGWTGSRTPATELTREEL